MDHPYDSAVVEFPDGSLVPARNFTNDATLPYLDTRIKDASFVLDELSNPGTVRQLIPGATRGLNTDRVGMYGHSLGGAAAVTIMVNDSRIVGGADLDGMLYLFIAGEVLKRGDVLLFGTEIRLDPTWELASPDFPE
jgi:hypothetical protein